MSLARRRLPALAVANVAFGRSRVEADLRTSLGLRLYRYPRWREAELRAVEEMLEPGDVFVDGGANVGLFTLVAAARVGPGGRVIAVEPGPVRATLDRNLALNGYHWVDVHAVALGSERRVTAFTYFDGDDAGLSSFAPAGPGGTVVEVEVRPIDDLVPEDVLPHVRLVKLDLEGAEVDALHGARRLLEDSRADFLVEVEEGHLARQGTSAQQLHSVFAGFDARPFPNSSNCLFLRRRQPTGRTGASPGR